MTCPSCGSDRAYDVVDYDVMEEGWVCPECGSSGGSPI